MIDRRDNKIIQTLLPLICILCNISQLPDAWGNRFISLAYEGLLIFVFFYSIYKRGFAVSVPRGLILICVTIVGFLFVARIIMRHGYITANLTFPMLLCVFVLLTGCQAGCLIDKEKAIKNIVYAYVFSSIYIAIVIFFSYFSGVDWLNAEGYIYLAKNSVAVIFLTSIVLIYYFILPKQKLLSILIILMFSYMIFVLKSRAAIFVWCIFIVYVLCINQKNFILRLFGILLCVVSVVYVLKNEYLYEIIVEKIILNNRTADLSTVSSGRDEHYKLFAKIFPENWLIGTGGIYLESFPLAVLGSFGVIGAIPVFALSFYPIIMLIVNRKNSREIDKRLVTVVFILNILLWANGVFEELTPFGPGVKCYMLWLLTGLYLSGYQRNRE